ncbi:DISARM system SNF2-like helicase DrmD [Streptomyces sp. NBC_00564]|uniref:DISARM system SNF2-like helicase DrmD n=1 Tax=Streptomyces sp. NBC_00564 TaxID=2903663 RepID=UPI00352D5DE9|nr:DISARM system SNF2-like helicase DrmD [Streptomyces sp. NBC_00564]
MTTSSTTDLAGVAQRAVRRRGDAQDPTAVPEISDLVEVRGQRWVVADVDLGESEKLDGGASRGTTLVTLNSVEDGRYNDTLSVIWEVEPGRRRLPAGSLPDVTAGSFDPPERLAAFLDAVRWSAVTSADVRTLQAPFRSGVAVEPYQLEPVSRAVAAPRVNLLLADDVGLGKTIEAGLVALELILRNRAHKIMIVCPAGLTVKWRDEMAEKFGLDFTIIDSERSAEVRRSHGSAANPFNIFPQCIVSLPWLRGPKAQRLLAEILPAENTDAATPTKRIFDLLILDEAHHVAPSAPKQLYPVDSQQTKLIRRLAPHFEHRLFLSATPHNGYQESYTALLEIVDSQRFARGVEPDPAAVKDTVVRRLKTDIREPDGTRRFLERTTVALPVEYTDDERRIHGLLKQYAQLRRAKLGTRYKGGRKAADLVTLLLKKRLFSSPDAFARTIAVYLDTLRTKKQQAAEEIEDWQETFFDDYADYDDEPLAEAEDDAIARATTLQPSTDSDEAGLLEEMQDWAQRHQAQADSKAQELITYLKANCLTADGKHWLNERVVVFTEYRDTQIWLQNLLRDHGLGGDRVSLLHGGMNTDDREQLRLAFQAEPAENEVRILLATDAASEGIDLQRHCHRLVNYDIPFNPNKLEQRIGRIDRYGQRTAPQIVHFIGSGYEKAADNYEADLEFLARVANKVARMEEDLGKVNAVLADAVQRRMTGDLRADFDVERAEAYAGRKAKRGGNVTAERDVQAQAQRLKDQVDATVSTLGITPSRVARVVSTALPLARQQNITPTVDEREFAPGFYEVPTLTGSWERASQGLADKLRPEIQRPITFDAQGAKGRDDVVLAHLGHPLVSMSTRLLRAAVWNKDQTGLARVAAVVSDHPELETTLVGAFARFVLVGADGVRLHEEVLQAGGWLRDDETSGGPVRFNRLEKITTLREILDNALANATKASTLLERRMADAWPQVSEGVVSSLEWRARNRQTALEGRLENRRREETERIAANIDAFRASLRAAIGKPAEEEGQLELAFDEADQQRRDRENWAKRLDALETEKEREFASIAARYAQPKPLLFPVAVVFVVPRREAVK